jgi:large subunit ribosomal protein L11
MAKKVQAVVKLQIAAGKPRPRRRSGTALGPHGLNIMDFCKNFNAKTAKDDGLIIPVLVTIYSDRSYSFVLKTPPAAVLLKRSANIAKGRACRTRPRSARSPRSRWRKIAKLKMPD